MYANRITPAGVAVLLGAALAWLIAALAVAGSTDAPTAAVIAATSVFGVLAAAVSWAISSRPTRRWVSVAGRAAVGVGLGVIVGELATVALLSGMIDRSLHDEAAVRANATPAVTQAAAGVQRSLDARAGLDDAVTRALQRRDEALIVARCEFNASPECPQTHITGLPGAGPENRTANEFLTDTTRQLDSAVAERDRRAPELASEIAAGEQALTQARETASADVDHGLGARWATMNDHTLAAPTAMLLRLLAIAFCVLVYLLPLILKLWRGETTHDRGSAARATREQAELEADTAIAVKKAEVRAAVETMWAEQQLASARLAVEAQTEIDREQHRRRVIEAVSEPLSVEAERVTEPETAAPELAAPAESAGELEPRREGPGSLVPTIPHVTKAATRWIRPFVPPIVATAVETATKPLRGVRQIFEEQEEVHFSMRRSRTVTVHTEEADEQVVEPEEQRISAGTTRTVVSSQRGNVGARTAPSITPGADGPRQLPPSVGKSG
ncbi:DUF4407 domain-containing protein [Mycobacterium sp. 2YAF39]|uniref:DUF4407 domain-containing protein n=1 Tax=Mycobacterium sp. 2YAF39 TaxID=3233033 RepID=UPI003F96872D